MTWGYKFVYQEPEPRISQKWNHDFEHIKIAEDQESDQTSRRRILRYKQASTLKEADFRQRVNKWMNFAKGLGMGVGVGWIGAHLTLLEQKSEMSPEQAITAVLAENPETLQTSTEPGLSAPKKPENTGISTDPLDISDVEGNISRTPQRGHLGGLNPMVSQNVETVLITLEKMGWQPRVAEGLRTLEEQQKKLD